MRWGFEKTISLMQIKTIVIAYLIYIQKNRIAKVTKNFWTFVKS